MFKYFVSAANDDLPLLVFFYNFDSMRNFAAISIQEPVYLKPGDNVVLPGVNQLTNNLTTNICSTGLTHRPGRVIAVGSKHRHNLKNISLINFTLYSRYGHNIHFR